MPGRRATSARRANFSSRFGLSLEKYLIGIKFLFRAFSLAAREKGMKLVLTGRAPLVFTDAHCEMAAV